MVGGASVDKGGRRGVGKEHLDRRKAILDATIDVVDSEGFDAVSHRRVAKEADVSLGRVQHYFPSKADLIAAAFVEVCQAQMDAVQKRADLAQRHPRAESPGSAEVLAREILHDLIPASAEQRRQVRVEHEMAVFALSFAPLRDRVSRMRGDLADLVGSLLASAVGLERIADLRHGKDEARGLLAFCFGLASYVVTGNIDASNASALVDRQIAVAIKRLRAGAKAAPSEAG